MKAAVISFTEKGDATAAKIARTLCGYELIMAGKTVNPRRTALSEWTRARFGDCGLIVFVGAVGIAVRACAPYIAAKDKDPAVIVVDEQGRYAIPILSGHIGGANRAAAMIAEGIGAETVITTATDINGCFAADEWAARNGYAIADIGEIKHISSAVLEGDKLGLVSEFKVTGELPDCIESGNRRCGIVIADHPSSVFEHTLRLIPKRYIIGAGCRAGASGAELAKIAERMLEDNNVEKSAVAAVATVDIKRNEPAIAELASKLGCEAYFYSAEELNAVGGEFSESEFVRSIVGVGNVCERAAVLCGEKQGRRTVIASKKTKGNGVTAALAVMEWSVRF